MLLDHMLYCLPVVGIMILTQSLQSTLLRSLLISFGLALYLNKDMYLSQSIVKRHFGYQVCKSHDSLADPFRCFLRNTTFIIWPIEIIALVFMNKRIGDIIAGCDVRKFDQSRIAKAPLVQYFITCIMSLLYCFVITYLALKSSADITI